MRAKCTMSAEGTCVDITTQTVTKRSTHTNRKKRDRVVTHTYTEYTLHISFTVDGKVYETAVSYDFKPSKTVGDNFEVLYNPEDPANNYIPST